MKKNKNFILYKFAGSDFVHIFASLNKKAQMAKLVDALVSGTSFSNEVQVRVLFWAQRRSLLIVVDYQGAFVFKACFWAI